MCQEQTLKKIFVHVTRANLTSTYQSAQKEYSYVTFSSLGFDTHRFNPTANEKIFRDGFTSR